MACRRIVDRWANGCTGLGRAIKKTLLASEILLPEVAERRRTWIETHRSDTGNMLERLVFSDDTSLKTNLVKTTGRAPVGKSLIDHAPFGHSLPPLRAQGNELIFLPPCSPDLNPIEMAFSKLKTVRRENDPPDRFLTLRTPKGRGRNLSSLVEKGRRSLQPVPRTGMPKLLRSSRIWPPLKATRSRKGRSSWAVIRRPPTDLSADCRRAGVPIARSGCTDTLRPPSL